MQPTDLAREMAKEFSPTALIEIRDAAQRFRDACMTAKDHHGAAEFQRLFVGVDAILDLGIGVIKERGLAALQLFENADEYWEYQMDMAGDMGRREVAEQLIGDMTLEDIREDYADMMRVCEED